MTGGIDWYAAEAFIDYWRSSRLPGLHVVLVSIGSWQHEFYAVTDDFGTLVEVRP